MKKRLSGGHERIDPPTGFKAIQHLGRIYILIFCHPHWRYLLNIFVRSNPAEKFHSAASVFFCG